MIHPGKYPNINLFGNELICFVISHGDPWCIMIPETLFDHIILWYHQLLSHIGMTKSI